jgi:hypothetical protein
MNPEEPEIKIGDLVQIFPGVIDGRENSVLGTGFGVVVYIFSDIETGYQVRLTNGKSIPFARDELIKVA